MEAHREGSDLADRLLGAGLGPGVPAPLVRRDDLLHQSDLTVGGGLEGPEVARLEASSTGRVWLNADGSMLSPRYYQILD